MRPFAHMHGLSISRSFASLVAHSRRITLLHNKLQLRQMFEQARMEERVPEPERMEAIGSSSGSASEREVKKAKRQFDFNM